MDETKSKDEKIDKCKIKNENDKIKLKKEIIFEIKNQKNHSEFFNSRNKNKKDLNKNENKIIDKVFKGNEINDKTKETKKEKINPEIKENLTNENKHTELDKSIKYLTNDISALPIIKSNGLNTEKINTIDNKDNNDINFVNSETNDIQKENINKNNLNFEDNINQSNNISNIINNSINKTPINDNKINNYEKFDSKNEYFLICPDCNQNILKIESLIYDLKPKDFLVTYKCVCNKKNKKYFYQIISENHNFCEKHNNNKLNLFCEICNIFFL